MSFFTPEMQRLQDEYMETMKTRDEMRDMLVTTSREHAVNGFSHDLERFTKTVECAYSIVNQIDLAQDATYQLKTIQEVNRGIHYANTTLKSILAKYNEMQNAVCHQQLLDAKKEKALPKLGPSDYLVLRDLVVGLHTEFDSIDSVYLSTWKAILLLKCLGYKESSKQLIQLIETRISRSADRKSDNRRVPLLRLLHFINANRARYDRHFDCLQEAKSHCSVVDDAVRLSMAKKLLAIYVPNMQPSALESLARRHDYNYTSRLSFLQFALMVGPLIDQLEQPDASPENEEDRSNGSSYEDNLEEDEENLKKDEDNLEEDEENLKKDEDNLEEDEDNLEEDEENLKKDEDNLEEDEENLEEDEENLKKDEDNLEEDEENLKKDQDNLEEDEENLKKDQDNLEEDEDRDKDSPAEAEFEGTVTNASGAEKS